MDNVEENIIPIKICEWRKYANKNQLVKINCILGKRHFSLTTPKSLLYHVYHITDSTGEFQVAISPRLFHTYSSINLFEEDKPLKLVGKIEFLQGMYGNLEPMLTLIKPT